MPRMEGKHHCASPLLFPSYISNFEQLEKERAVTIVWVFFWSDGDRSYTNENHFSALLSASYFFKVWTPQVVLHRSNQIWIPQLWPQFPKLADGDTLPLAINTQTTVATSLLCLHNTTAINTVAHTASPHCGSSRRRNTNWNSFVAQITSGALHLPICPQRREATSFSSTNIQKFIFETCVKKHTKNLKLLFKIGRQIVIRSGRYNTEEEMIIS